MKNIKKYEKLIISHIFFLSKDLDERKRTTINISHVPPAKKNVAASLNKSFASKFFDICHKPIETKVSPITKEREVFVINLFWGIGFGFFFR